MKRKTRHFVLLCGPILLALMLTACGPSSSTPEKPVQVHGDLITPVQQASPKIAVVPAATASASNPKMAQVTTVSVAPKASASLPSIVSRETSVPSASEYLRIGFDKLASYNFEVDDTPVTNVTPATDKANQQIPASVKAFDDKKVSITGFMLPLKVSDGSVTEFLIMKDQSMCCYGTVPKITEWVNVKTPGHGVKSIMDQPVSIEGTLHIGAMRENGYLIGIYQMDGDKLIAPEN